jgi:hypothetical protein
MDLKIEEMQFRYYENFLHDDDQDIISLEEMDELIKGYLVDKEGCYLDNTLTWNDELL